MKVQWCWRCRMDVPMLDEEEFARVHEAYRAAFSSTATRHPTTDGVGRSASIADAEARFRPILDVYRELTAFEETNPAAVMHHRLMLYGPPCTACGKPLRSPRARLCTVCGTRVEATAPAI